MNTIVSFGRPATLGAHDALLRAAIRLDAWASGIFGVALIASAGLIGDAVGAPPTFLWAVGGVSVLYGAVLGLLRSRTRVRRPIGFIIVAANAGWVVVSVLLLISGWLPLTQVGVALVILQGLGVAALTDFQLIGVMRARN